MGSSDRPVETSVADVAVKSAKSSELRKNSLSDASNSSSKSNERSDSGDRSCGQSSDNVFVPSHYSSTSSIASSCSVANYSGKNSASLLENSGIYSYNNRIPTIQSLHVSAVRPDVIASNIQKNIEHCKLQRLQQIENVTRNNNEASQFLSRGNVILRMRGLPYDCTAKQVVDFFEDGEEGVSLVEQEDGVLFVRKPDGRATGDAFVMLSSEEDIALAMSKHKLSIGTRYIELFRSSSGEVMNRAMDLRHMEQQQQQQQQQGPPALPPGPASLPLIATLPHMPQQLIPQASVATGPKKNCIRLRGLPYEAQIEHVLEFLGDFSNSICFRGVHMVYTTQLSNETCYQSHPSGEAFIQMVSEQAAYTTAAHRHNKYMVFGKKNRYIEVFQCSNDDMNFVLSGMAPSSPQTPTAPPVNPRSLVPTPGGGPVISPYGPTYSMGLSPAMMGHTMGAPPRISPYASPMPASAPYSPVYYYYPSPPVSPTSAAYYSTIPPHATIISECVPLPPDLALHHHHQHHLHHPGEAVATM